MTASTSLADLAVHPLWTAASDGLVIVDRAGTIALTNRELDRLFGYGEGELLGRSVSVLIPTDAHGVHARHMDSYWNGPAARPMAASQLLEGRRADGSHFPVNVGLSPIDTSDGPRVVAAVRDLTLWVASERTAAIAERQRAMADDHDRIARELHDTVIQRLFALGLGLQGLPMRIDDDTAIAGINRAVDTVDQIIGEIRATIHGLKAPAPPDRRPRLRILAVISEMEEVLSTAPHISLDGPVDALGDDALIDQLLPTLRESLANIARHADADTVQVTIEVSDTQVTMRVTDDGTGIDPAAARSGLANIATRAAALGGTVEVTPNEPSGTVVTWTVPRNLPTVAD